MTRASLATVVLAVAFGLRSDAQGLKPIYLQYDGFIRNASDRTLTLSFGYYNMNPRDISIPAGDANRFAPGPVDRRQPVTLLAGRHRFACTIVVPEDFDGRLQWQLTFAGVTTATTDRLFDPLYQLEPNSQRRVMTGLDLRTAPKGVCANHSPTVQIINPNVDSSASDTVASRAFFARVGIDLILNAEVEDDGLPRSSKITLGWRQKNGPGTVMFSSIDTVPTRAAFGVPGVYELELSATDGERSGSVTITVTVTA